jgi:hypothetical protein
VLSEDNPTCDIALEGCGVCSVDQVLDRLARPEEEPEEEEEEEVAEHKPTLLDALKGLEVARKYVYGQFGIKNSVIVMCSRVENELYRLKTEEKEETKDSC